MAKIYHNGKWWNDPADRTAEERAELFGDAGLDAARAASHAEYEVWLVERFHSGLPMTRDMKRQARLFIKGRR